MVDKELRFLPHLKDHIAIAKEVEKEFRRKRPLESNETEKKNNFFVYHFLHRTIAYCESIELLAEKGFYHEAILVARTVLEGLINFEYYKDHHDMADKWSMFRFYEDVKKAADTASLVFKRERQKTLEKEQGKKLVARAEKEFPFNYLLRETQTFSKQKLPDLISKIENAEIRLALRHEYDTIYGEFSQIAHWSPSGVIGGHINVLAALTIAVDALSNMCREANKKYELGFEKRIVELKKAASKTLKTLTT